jgi:hypothetical protein
MTKKEHLPASGHTVITIPTQADTIQFLTDGTFNFENFKFTKNAGNFTKRSTYIYAYDGRPIPAPGAEFKYDDDALTVKTGNGTGVIKNN